MNNWINTADAVPGDDSYVLVADRFEHEYIVTEGSFGIRPNSAYMWHALDGEPLLNVTHWMPLPEPPQ